MNKIQLQKQLLQETKYSKWYLNIIENAQSKNRIKLNKIDEEYMYYENHHILPQTLFKKYKNLNIHKWNGVLLTAREHFICHKLIQKHYRSINYTYGDIKMSKAIIMMSGKKIYKAKHYEYIKINLEVSDVTKDKISSTLMGHDVSEGTKQKIRDKRKFQVISKETGRKISASNMGRIVTEETRNKISKGNKNKPKSEAHKKSLREARKNVDIKGLKNPRANLIEIYNNENVLIGVSEGNFEQTCTNLNISHSAFKKSYQEGIKVYEGLVGKSMIAQLKNKDLYKYKDWYAVKIDETTNQLNNKNKGGIMEAQNYVIHKGK